MSQLFDFIDGHRRDCEFRRTAIAGLSYECEHGHHVCPICDPCTCDDSQIALLPPVTRSFGTQDRPSGSCDGIDITTTWTSHRH